jgi:DNA polymerase III alpha subunit
MPVGETIDRGWIRPGLRFISGLTARGMKLIISERERRGPFTTFHNFLRRCPLYDDEITTLVRCGACDGFFHDSPETSRAQALLEAALFRDRASLNLDSLFEDTPSGGPTSLNVEPFSRFDICQMEIDHLGFMITGHPLDFAEIPRGIVPACQIRNHTGETIRMIGWGIAAKLLSARNNRKPMKMLTLEDRTGTYEATLFPRVYAKFATRTLTKGPYLVTGEVDVTLGSPTLNVRKIELLPMKQYPGIAGRNIVSINEIAG